MINIKKIANTAAAYSILDNSNCAGSTWTQGGCAILAQALNKLEGYPIYVIYNTKYNSPEHFGVMTSFGSILDADGEHTDSDAWLKFFKENEMPRGGELIVIPFSSDINRDGINFDDKASDELANLIKNYKMIQETVRDVLRENINEAYDSQYKSWKRKNVTIRGMSDVGQENSAGARFGSGLYTAFLGNRAMAKEYGEVYFVVGAIPKNPIIVNDTNQAEIWIQYNLYKYEGEDFPNPRRFYDEGKTIEGEMLKRGHDGLVIKGREMVNFSPGEVLYFRTENELFDYYNYNVRNTINESANTNRDNSFLDWLSMKLGKKIGREIGSGMYGRVFEMGPVVIKISNTNMFDSTAIANKNILGVAKVYAHGKINVPSQFIKKDFDRYYAEFSNSSTSSIILKEDMSLYYLIMERVNVDNGVENDIEDIVWSLESYFDDYKKKSAEVPVLRELFEERNNEKFIMDFVNFIKNDYTDSEKSYNKYLETIAELLVVFRSVGKHFDWMDIHAGQFGRNSKGELVAFDFDNPNVATRDFYKHIVREKVELKNGDISHSSMTQIKEGQINETALRAKDLTSTTALFVRDINQGFDITLYDPKTKEIFGTLTAIWRNDSGMEYYVSGVSAKKGFGPFIYELAMMHASQDKKGLMPTRDGDIRKGALSVWSKFYDRTDVLKKTLSPDSPYFKFDILFSGDDFESEEDRESWLDEASDADLRILKIFNTIYYLNQSKEYDELVGRANSYINNGFDEQRAIDAAEKFWFDSYL